MTSRTRAVSNHCRADIPPQRARLPRWEASGKSEIPGPITAASVTSEGERRISQQKSPSQNGRHGLSFYTFYCAVLVFSQVMSPLVAGRLRGHDRQGGFRSDDVASIENRLFSCLVQLHCRNERLVYPDNEERFYSQARIVLSMSPS